MFFSSSVLEYLPLILYILGYHENRGLRIHPINKRTNDQTNKRLQVDFFFRTGEHKTGGVADTSSQQRLLLFDHNLFHMSNQFHKTKILHEQNHERTTGLQRFSLNLYFMWSPRNVKSDLR